jgi:hypothetical protein
VIRAVVGDPATSRCTLRTTVPQKPHGRQRRPFQLGDDTKLSVMENAALRAKGPAGSKGEQLSRRFITGDPYRLIGAVNCLLDSDA